MSGDDRSGPVRPPSAAARRVGSAGGRAVAALALASTRRPLVTVVISLLLAAAGALYTLHALTFVTSNLRLLPQNASYASYVVRLRDYQRDFGELNDIVVAVEAAGPDRSKAYAARLVADLERQGVTRSRITYRVDPSYFEGRALLYLSQDDLAKLRDRLFDYQEFIEGYAARPTLPQLLAGLNQQIANSMALGFFDVGLRGSGGATDLRFLESVIDQISRGSMDRLPTPHRGPPPSRRAASTSPMPATSSPPTSTGCSCSCSSVGRRAISRTAAAPSRPSARPSPRSGPTSRTSKRV